MSERPQVLVGKTVTVRRAEDMPAYYTGAHRARMGCSGIVHAIVPAMPPENPLVKVKFDDGAIVFFRLRELDVREPAQEIVHERHGERGSHLPPRRR